MKVGILGGTFDPPHIGHLVGAKRALEQLKLDKVIFVPNNIPPHKKPPVASAQDRFNMTKLATEGEKYFDVSDYEIKKGGISYTVETVEHFSKMGYEIYLLIGEDSLYSFHTWKDYKKILELAKIAWFPRINTKKNYSKIPESIKIESEILDISSTKIREYVKKGISIRWLVPDKVIDYINKRGLYR